MLAPFDYRSGPRLVFGAGTVEQVGELARELGGRKALVVTDAGLRAAGHAERVREGLARASLEVTLFDQTRENPTTLDVDHCLAAAPPGVDLLVALGGGSALDTAKGANLLLTNGGRIQDYWGIGKASRPMLPLIAIPTTAGTGSECQSAALIADETTHRKMACLDRKATPRVAILDPELTLSLPPRVTACSGVDALAHALEASVTRRQNPLSSLFAREAFLAAASGLPRVLEQPNDLEARGGMLLGAAWAGVAIEHSMLGAAHAAANPLTERCGLVHGQAVGLMLPAVIRYNACEPAARDTYARLARLAGLARPEEAPELASARLATWFEEMVARAGFPKSLGASGLCADLIPALAADAAGQWTAGFNPRPVGAADFAALYQDAWGT